MVKNIKNNLTNIVVVIGLIASIGAGFSKFAKMEEQVKVLRDASKSIDIVSVEVVEANIQNINSNGSEIIHNRLNLNKNQTAIAILKKEIQLLNLQIKEIKVSNSNPLQ